MLRARDCLYYFTLTLCKEEGILTLHFADKKIWGLMMFLGLSEFTGYKWRGSGFSTPLPGFSTGTPCPFHSANIGGDGCYVTNTLDGGWHP